MMKFNLRGALIAALALATLALGPAPSYAAAENKGSLSSKIDSSDRVTGKEAVAVTSPTAGTPSVAVQETVHYLHKRWFWQNDQIYTIQVNGTAEYVGRLDYWMFKDADGTLYRFNKGSTIGIETAKPTVEIGTIAAPMASNDSSSVSGVSAGSVSADGSTRTLNVATRYTHVETYNNVNYAVNTTVNGTYVQLQNAHMAWIGGTLYRADSTGTVQALREKPSVNVGVRSAKISASDRVVSSDPSVSAGSVSFNGRSRSLIATRDYIHEETFQKQRYSLQDEFDAPLVSEQNSYMAWISDDLYRVRVGSDDVVRLSSRPVTNLGQRSFKIENSDPLTSVVVTPTGLTTDSKSIIVSVRRYYRHTETYQVKEYFGQSTDVARYNEHYRVWTVIVDGRIYAIAYDGDVVNDGNVVVVHAPPGMHKPDVLIVNTGDGEPPVVVPGKRKPPVVNNGDDNPPVVVPGKRKPPVVVDTDDGPPIVVPGRR